METCRHDELQDKSASDTAAALRSVPDTSVSVAGAGIGEVLRMRVGCWSPPVHFSTAPTAA